jgi:O-antigen/teichoic acid export membrane protein
VFFYGLASIGATGMVLTNDQRPQAAWWAAGMVVSAGMNLALVPRFGAIAAAVANCVSFAVIAAGVLYTSERRLPLSIDWRVLAPSCAVLAAAGLAGAPAWSASPLASLGLKLPVGVLVTVLTLRLVAPDWFARGVGAVRGALARG